MTSSSVLWSETTGEFSNDHVYWRAAAGGNWLSRSTGLAQANPINSIVIDPADSNRLFCGGDLGRIPDRQCRDELGHLGPGPA